MYNFFYVFSGRVKFPVNCPLCSQCDIRLRHNVTLEDVLFNVANIVSEPPFENKLLFFCHLSSVEFEQATVIDIHIYIFRGGYLIFSGCRTMLCWVQSLPNLSCNVTPQHWMYVSCQKNPRCPVTSRVSHFGLKQYVVCGLYVWLVACCYKFHLQIMVHPLSDVTSSHYLRGWILPFSSGVF